MTNELISSKFKELNSSVAHIISGLKEDSDQNASIEERTDEIIKIFSVINDDIERIKNSINDLLDDVTREEFKEENIKLEVSFKVDLKPKNINFVSGISNLNQDIVFNREEVKLISDHTKKEIENISKEVHMQEKNLNLMNYTKFFKNIKSIRSSMGPGDNSNLKKNNENYTMHFSDEKIKISMEILKDIQKTKILIHNFIRIDYKFDIDEYMAIFLRDKNEFINEFKTYLDREGRNLNIFSKKNYLAILEILKAEIDQVLRDFKNLKQKILKKMRKKENFWKIKEDFIKHYKNIDQDKENRYSVNAVTSMIQSKYNNLTAGSPIQKNQNVNDKSKTENNYIELFPNPTQPPVEDNSDVYKESAHTINLFKESETKDLDKTKQIISELSDLMTNFSTKVLEHQTITQNIISNASLSLDNAKKANKQLVQAQDYQKGRGVIIGSIFILLGLFLMYYDYAS